MNRRTFLRGAVGLAALAVLPVVWTSRDAAGTTIDSEYSNIAWATTFATDGTPIASPTPCWPPHSHHCRSGV